MKNIRNNVFETNSSSVHSISVSKDGLESSKLSLDNNGYVVVGFGNFGSDLQYYNSQIDKLSYLITQCYYSNYNYYNDYYWCQDIYSAVEESYNFKCIEDAIKSYINDCSGIKIKRGTIPDIDHQSQGKEIVDYWDDQSIINFVFNKYISLKTSCD